MEYPQDFQSLRPNETIGSSGKSVRKIRTDFPDDPIQKQPAATHINYNRQLPESSTEYSESYKQFNLSSRYVEYVYKNNKLYSRQLQVHFNHYKATSIGEVKHGNSPRIYGIAILLISSE